MKILRLLGAVLATGVLLLALVGTVITRTIDRTLLDAGFLARQLASLDLPALARSVVEPQLDEQARTLVGPVLTRTLQEQQAHLRAQTDTALAAALGYLRGERATLQVQFDARPVADAFLANLRDQLRNDPPAEIKKLPPAERAQALAELDREIAGPLAEQVRAMNFDDRIVTPEVRRGLDEVRVLVALFLRVGTISLVTAVLAAAALAWLGSLRALGIVLLVVGALLAAGGQLTELLVRQIPAEMIAGMPDGVAGLVPALLSAAFAPVTQHGLFLLGAGIAVIVAGVILARARRAPAAAITVPPPAASVAPAASVEPQAVAPAPVPPPPPAAATPVTGVAPARGWMGQPRWLWFAGGAVALLAAAWLGDVVNRYRASSAHQRAQMAFLSQDWTGALEAARDAARHRPTDLDYRREFDALQEKWLRYQTETAAGQPPEDVQRRLEGDPARLAPILTEPHATQFRNFSQRILRQVQENVGAEAERALDLGRRAQFAEAHAAMRQLEPRRKYHASFDKALEELRRLEARDGLDRALSAADRADFAAARAALASVAQYRALVAEDFAGATAGIELRELMHGLAQAVEQAERGDFTAALAGIAAGDKRAKELAAQPDFLRSFEIALAGADAATRARVQPAAQVADAQNNVRRAIVRHVALRLAGAIGRKDAREAQAALDQLAELTRQPVLVTAEQLLGERNFDAFLEHLVSLGIRPATEEERTHRADLIMVETMRGNFARADAVAQFIGRSYAEWAQEVAPRGQLGLALYLARQARAAGGVLPADFEPAVRADLAKNYGLTVRLAPTEAESDTLPFRDTWSAAVRNHLTAAAGKWITVEEAAAEGDGFILRPRLRPSPGEHLQRQFPWNISYQSGVRRDRNQRYDSLAYQLQQAQASYNDIRNAAAQAQAQSQAAANSGNAWLALAGVATNAYAGASVDEAANRVNALYAELNQTPQYIETPVYAEDTVQVITHSIHQAVALELDFLAGGDVVGTQRWDSQLRYTTREWPASTRANVPARRAALLSPRDTADRLGRNLAAQVAAQPHAVVQPLVQALFQHAEKQLVGATPLDRAEVGWALVELWQDGGVTVADRPEREVAVRRALGLPVAGAGGTVAANPNPAAVVSAATAAAGAAASPAARASVAGPFENSLGHRLVPVPGTGVLISAWETRRRDFEAFVKETKHDMTKGSAVSSITANGWAAVGATWQAPGFAQDENHPVVGVSWNDAKAFCEWLTRKERAAGLIGPNQRYRLPSDAEWSAAVGLVSEPAGAPAARNKVVPGFAWGRDWPPPVGAAGNIGGFEVRDLPWPSNWAVIDDYGDGFAGTSPVGHYAPNRLGLYDLEGNVSEFCEDLYSGTGANRTVRGPCFSYQVADIVQLSYRGEYTPDVRFTGTGFRVVLTVDRPL